MPNTAFWWMTEYAEFGWHLQGRYRELLRREDTCVIFDLREVRELEAVGENAASDGTANGRPFTPAARKKVLEGQPGGVVAK